ncbi:TIM barrel protein [Granulosicoccus antarcticus]|uniref:Xylose isomerase-like TIM barrel domain-containing protein n=1 Tax=Granulosicoccus antarcticus IMCC3135 TaxID=1192854 RepID=A0A2Z2P3K3_9GAMM|nr:TIM barrel protein [Granulosicoccus antarcticus]ASJ74374.1 hypothetical protein IMCC3135_21485 [Granulosicoccus antarcticus IMCC3135]
MFGFALNHMTLAKASYAELLKISEALECVGIEVRNDLNRPLFDGLSAKAAGQAARDANLSILALAEVCAFDDFSPEKLAAAQSLMRLAVDCGAQAISLIPRNDAHSASDIERQDNLIGVLRQLQPLLEDHGLIALIEPLGFSSCSLRSKQDAVAAIGALDAAHCFKLVHDTFHHHVSGGGPVFAEHTGIVHVSGVVDAMAASQMLDADRILVDEHDQLGNIAQLRQLLEDGYQGPVSFEAFAPAVHDLPDHLQALRASCQFITSRLHQLAA